MLEIEDPALALRKLIDHWVPEQDVLTRELVCTPILACHESLSHWVVSVAGSPPRGTLLLPECMYGSEYFFISLRGDTKKVTGNRQRETILSFFDAYLAEANQEIRIPVEATVE